MCIFCLYTMRKVVGYYECSVHVSDGFPQTKFGWLVGGVSSIQVFLGFFEFV